MSTASSLRVGSAAAAPAGACLNAFDTIAASVTDSVLVAANGNRRIRVLAYMVNQGDTTPSSVQFNSKGAGAGTSIWPAIKYPANGGSNSPFVPTGWFSTNPGEALTVSTGAGSNTGVGIIYDFIA